MSADPCCYYVVAESPSRCPFTEGDIVVGPCDGGCADRLVIEPQPSPCDGLYLVAIRSDCMTCDPAATTDATDFAARVAKARARAKQALLERSPVRLLTPTELRLLRVVREWGPAPRAAARHCSPQCGH